MNSHYKHIIFDFDGTIADTLDFTRLIYNEIASEDGYKIVAEADVPHLQHMGISEICKELQVPKYRVPGILMRGRNMLKSRVTEIPLCDGVEKCLPLFRAQVDHFGILTSNSAENVRTFLEHYQLDPLFSFVSSVSKLTGKAKHLRSICRTFSIAPRELLYIGDEIRDVKAAQKAGVAVAAVTWGYNNASSLEESNPDYLISSPEQLLEI